MKNQLPNTFDYTYFLNIIDLTMQELYKNDKYLFDCNSSERNLVFHFGRYFIDILKEKKFDLKTYSVDCEYNRDISNENLCKEIMYENNVKKIIPDLLLHIRGNNIGNIIAIEFKKKKYKIDYDRVKLKKLTSNDYKYKYKIGLLIIFKNGKNYQIEIYINGSLFNEYQR